MLDVLGSLLSAGVNLFTGMNNKDSQEKIAAQNIALQKEFAQHGIQWKVEDAKAAGLHPLAALGAQTSSFSPVSVGSTDFGSLGQDLSRAFKAAGDIGSREALDAEKGRKLALEKAGLENDILRADLMSRVMRTSRQGGQVGPPMPTGLPSNWLSMVSGGPPRTVSEGAAVSGDEIKQKAEDYPATKIARPFGYPLAANPWFGDGQSYEDRYGESEMGSTIKWGTNMLADHIYSGWKWGLEPLLDRIPPVQYGRRYRRSYRPWAD